jgi:hypothetical protein
MVEDAVRTRSKNGGAFGSEGIVGPAVLVPAPIHAIECLEECRIDDMQFVRADPDNGAYSRSKSRVRFGIMSREL